MSNEATVRVRPHGGTWSVLGSDIAPGCVPEGLVCSADQAGPTQLSFTVRRDTTLPWRDLLPFTEIEVEAPGAGVVWSGRVSAATPGADGAWSVTCRGWQFHLDDDVFRRLWVHQRLGDWQDCAGRSDVNPSIYGRSFTQAGGFVGSFRGGEAVGNNATGGGRMGVYLDGGEAGAIARVVITWESSANGVGTDWAAYLFESDTDPLSDATNTVISYITSASGTFSRTLATPRRFVTIALQNNTAGVLTPTNSVWFKVTGAIAVRDTAYESGNASVLRASTVIEDTLAFAPLLSADTRLIATSGLIDAGVRGVPHLTTEGSYETPRQVMQRANAYHDWLVGVDATKRVFFRERPTVPLAELGAWSGSEFSDAGDDGDELYNRVLVQATGIDGQAVQVERTSDSPLLTIGGATRTRILGAQAALTVAAAEVIGDAWLARRVRRPTRGSITAAGAGRLRMLTSGAPVTPAEMLRWPGELVRLADRWDPDTGGWGRDATISQVTWTADTDTVQLTLDSPKERLDVVLGRYAAIQAARPQAY